MTNDQIERGDIVTVLFVGSSLRGEVRYLPNSTDRCWVIKDSKYGKIHYIKDFVEIIKDGTIEEHCPRCGRAYRFEEEIENRLCAVCVSELFDDIGKQYSELKEHHGMHHPTEELT